MNDPAGYVTHADLGGRTGFGPVVPEDEDVRFHAFRTVERARRVEIWRRR